MADKLMQDDEVEVAASKLLSFSVNDASRRCHTPYDNKFTLVATTTQDAYKSKSLPRANEVLARRGRPHVACRADAA